MKKLLGPQLQDLICCWKICQIIPLQLFQLIVRDLCPVVFSFAGLVCQIVRRLRLMLLDHDSKPFRILSVISFSCAAKAVSALSFNLRHSFASKLMEQGESLASVKEQMRVHAIRITVEIYGHLAGGE